MAGDLPAPPGWIRVAQRGDGLAERIVHAYADTRIPGVASLLIGMDTPQAGVALLASALARLAADATDAVLGPAADGGWWALGLRDPGDAAVLADVPMSTPDTMALTLAALRRRRLRVAQLATLTDVDTAADARKVAALCPPDSRFARTVAGLLPAGTLP